MSKWDLTTIFKTLDEWQIEKKEIENLTEQIGKYQGKLEESSNNILECYTLYEKILEKFEKVYAYAMLNYHQNMADTSRIALYKDVESLGTRISMETSFITPELSQIDKEKLIQYVNENKNLQRYKRIIDEIIENKKHVLSREGEKIIASFGEVFSASENGYDIFTETEFEFPEIIGENGEKVKITHANYSKYLMSKNQEVRKQAFNSMYSLYKKHINTITELYLARVKERVVESKLRKYDSSLDSAVHADDATKAVYDSLVKVVDDKLYLNHRYLKLKKKLLANNEIHLYDVYVNVLEVENKEIKYEDAQTVVLDALKPLGEQYQNLLKQAFVESWLDVYPAENKKSGAYSLGVYGCHPYVLLNYTNQEEDVSTIAHELGHAIHSYYSNSNQNVIDANYTIMVAEVASTVNEIILGQYLINKEDDKHKKAALINNQLDRIRATLIRQTMFAEFEKIVHEKVEKQESLTSDELCEIYYELNKKYFGDDTVIDEPIKYEWARIPHFYSCFYVYKYATGISSAIAIAKKVLEQGETFVNRYIDMLKQGCSKKSIDLLKMVEVDLESTKPYEEAFEFFEKNLEELEKLID